MEQLVQEPVASAVTPQVDRRSALKAGAVVAGTLAYAVPALSVLNMGVAEATSGKLPSPEKGGKLPSPEKATKSPSPKKATKSPSPEKATKSPSPEKK